MAQNWVVYCFMYWDLMVYYFMYWRSMWRASLRSTAARAHLPRQVPECGWATHSVHKPHRHHGSSQVVFGDAGGVTPPEVIPIHRVLPIHWGHCTAQCGGQRFPFTTAITARACRQDRAIYNTTIREHAFSTVVLPTALFAECFP